MQNKDKFGFYQVGDLKFYSKFDAAQFAANTNLYVGIIMMKYSVCMIGLRNRLLLCQTYTERELNKSGITMIMLCCGIQAEQIVTTYLTHLLTTIYD